MKTKIFCVFALAGILATGSAFSQAAHGGGGGAARAGGVVAPRTGITPVTPANGNGTVQSGIATQNGLNAANGINQTLPSSATNSNAFAGTNGFSGANGATASANSAIRPANNFPAVNSNFNGNIVVPDQAVSSGDRILLGTLNQGVRSSLGIAPNGNTPVHFLIKNGTVTVVGTVPSAAQSQAVLSQIQQTPGVLSVINDMHVNNPTAPAAQNPSGRLGVQSDRAFSAADQTLLTTVQQEASAQLGVTSLAQMPVHFSIQNGVIAVTGEVASLQEKQALLTTLGGTPGIVRVVDNVGVIPNATAVSGLNSGFVAPSSTTPNGLAPASRNAAQPINNPNGTANSGFVSPSSATPNGLTPTSREPNPLNSRATAGTNSNFVSPSSTTPNGLSPTTSTNQLSNGAGM